MDDSNKRYKSDADTLKIIGNNITQQRKLKGFSIEQLSFDSGISRSQIHNYEHALVNMNVTSLKSIADALKINFTDLFVGV